MSNEAIDMKDVLERVQDDRELLVELLQIYCDDFVEKLPMLQSAVERNDFEQMRGLAHGLKGASGNISAKSLRMSFMELEEMAKNQDFGRAKEVLAVVQKQFEELKSFIANNIKK